MAFGGERIGQIQPGSLLKVFSERNDVLKTWNNGPKITSPDFRQIAESRDSVAERVGLFPSAYW